jgi:Phosphoesterase family
MRRIGALVVAVLLALAAATPAGAKTRIEGVPSFGHVFLIIGENTDYSHIDATNTPFLMDSVRPNAAWFENYYSATHWSQANYVAQVSGQFNACEQKDGGIACQQSVDNLYHRLDLAGSTWKVWLEAGSAKCDTGSGGSCSSDTACPQTGFYTTGNPPIVFDDIPFSECLADDVPAGTPTAGMSIFNADLASGDVAAFNTIIPNGCDDGERNCKPVNDRYTQFDNFLATEVPLIQRSPAFGNDGVIIITYDESERADGQDPANGLGDGGHTVCAVISPLVVPGEYAGVTYAYSVLRTLQDGFGTVLPGYLGAANEVTPLQIWR